MQEELLANVVVTGFALGGIVLAVTFARAVWGTAAGWIAGWLAVITPASIDVARFGRVDHHVFEPIVLLAGLHPAMSPVLRGVVVGLSLGISQSMILPICVAAGAVTLSGFLPDTRPRSAMMAKSALLTAAPVVVLTCWAHDTWFDYRQVGLFQLGVLALWYMVAEACEAPTRTRRTIHGIAGAALGAVLAIPLLQSAHFLETNVVLNFVSEVRSGFDLEVLRTAYLTDNVFLWPFVLGFLALAVVRNNPLAAVHLELFVAGLAVSGAALLQARFFPLLAAVLAVSAGGFLGHVGAGMVAGMDRDRGIPKGAGRALAAILLTLWFGWSVVRVGLENFLRPSYAWGELTRATYEMLDWTRENTPDPGWKGDPRVAPWYGMLAPWYLGHHLIYVAERPAVTTPFLFDASTPGLLDSIRFYFSDSPGEALARIRRLKVRYVLVPLLAAEANIQLSALDRDLALSHRIEFERGASLVPGSLFRRTMAGKLYFEDEVRGTGGDRLRLVHEVPVAGSQEVKIRLFELEVEQDSSRPRPRPVAFFRSD